MPLPTHIGRYVVRRELARGGMGVVYVCWDPSVEREVAIKVVLAPTDGDQQRFLQEVKAMGRLRHPTLVPLTDFGTHRGHPFLVMELVPGGSLKARLDREGPLPGEEAARIVARLARGLQHAHEQGVLHRDLKPENVLLDEGGRPRLTDFGLALVEHAQHDRLTTTGELLGTPAYMSPEQADGRWDQVDARTDVYGLGATLYRLLTGETPHRGSTAVQIVTSVLMKEPTPLNEHRPVDPQLEEICLRCLAKAQDDRFASAEELAEHLEAWLGSRDRPRAALRTWQLLTLSLVVIGAAAAVVASRRAERSAAATPPRTETPTLPVDPSAGGSRAETLTGRAAALLVRGEVEPALPLLDEALQLDPDLAEAWAQRGRAASLRARWDDAERDLGRALRLAPDRAELWLLRARSRRRRFRFSREPKSRELAAKDLAQVLRLRPEHAGALALLATERFQAGAAAQSEGERYLARALQAAPDDPWVLSATSESLMWKSVQDPRLLLKRIALLDQAATRAPHEVAFPLRRAECNAWYARYVAERREDVERFFAAADADARRAQAIAPADPFVLHTQGWLKKEHGRALQSRKLDLERADQLLREARDHLRKTLEAYPGSQRAWVDLGLALGFLTRFGEAIDALRRARRLSPNDPVARLRLSEAHSARGTKRLNEHQIDGALADLDEAIRLHPPKTASTWNHRGLARALRAQWPGALKDFDEALRREPRSAPAWCFRGRALQLRSIEVQSLRDDTEILRCFGRAIELRPNYGAALAFRAMHHRVANRHAQADADVQRGIAVAPNDPWVALARAERRMVKELTVGSLKRQIELAGIAIQRGEHEPTFHVWRAWRWAAYARAARTRRRAEAHFQNAKRDLENAMRIDPKDANTREKYMRVMRMWAETLRRFKAHAEAARHLEACLPHVNTSIRLYPRNVRLLLHRAEALASLRRFPEAIADVGRALALAPKDPRVKALLARLTRGDARRRSPPK